MADDIRVSYSIDPGAQADQARTAPAPAARAAAAEALVAFTDCELVDLGNGAVLLQNRDNGQQLAVQSEVATALTYCGTFRTLHEHALALVNTLPQLQGQLADVTGVLQMVAGAGLFTRAETICARLDPAAAPPTSLAPTRVCIITCDRPAAVQRLLESMLHHAQLARHEELFLVDDSRDPANGAENRELVARFNLSSPKNMHYVGAEAQRALLQQLVVERPALAAASRFLLDRERWADQASYGLARTVSLLLTVGRRCITLDDDVLCRSVAPPQQAAGISFGGDPRQLACFGSDTELLQQARFLDTDPLAGHARCLGMPVARAIGALEPDPLQSADLHDCNAALLKALQPDSPVLISQCGSWGDPGSPGTSLFYHLERDSVARLLAAPGGLAGAAANRHYWLGRTRPNFSKMAIMSQATGLDNSHLLPPYFPVFRGEDYLFASMAFYLHPHAAVLDYPWSVPHLPLEQRGASLQAPTPSRGGLALCARYIAERVDQAAGGSAATRLQQLALTLRELSERGPASLLATYRAELAREQASQARLLDQQLQVAQELGSQEWQGYLQGGAENVAGALQTPASPAAIPEAGGKLSDAELLQRFRTVTGEFSEALAAWPEIREAAAVISSRMLAAGELMA